MKPEDRYCKRIVDGDTDMRELYNPKTDKNAHLSDDMGNFKRDPKREEDVLLFNYAFCDRISRIFQKREEYFHNNKLLIDLYDAYSNLVFQLHMFELYRDNTIKMLGRDYMELNFDKMLIAAKEQYNFIIALSDPKNSISNDDIIAMTEEIDRMSQNIHGFGFRLALPY